MWTFAVSGYRLVRRWIEARVGLPADLGLVNELRIGERVDLFAEADIVLEATLHETLTCVALGFGGGGRNEDGGST